MGCFEDAVDFVTFDVFDLNDSKKPPPGPEPLDITGETLNWIQGITDPRIQGRLLDFERAQREQWRELGLKDMYETTLGPGTDVSGGTVSLLERILPQVSRIQSEAMSRQREADIEDVQRLGAQATNAMRASDPAMQALLEKQGAMTSAAYDRAQGVTPQQQRIAEQQARAAGTARGRGMGQSTIAAEILGREDFQRQNRAEAQQMGGNYFEMLKRTAADPYQAILARPGTAYGGATQQQGFGASSISGMMGPQLIDPTAGINLGLMQQSNLMNYNASIYGAEQAKQGSLIGGLFSGLGAAIGCWVAREVFGKDDYRWLLFRVWLFTMAPKWFFNLYIKHGETFAQWISNKPILKGVIRKWMEGRIATLEKGLNHAI